MKKNIWFPVCVLVVAALFSNCDSSTEPPKDTWNDITSLDQLHGTWKGTHSQTITIRQLLSTFDMWDPAMAMAFGDMKVTISVPITFTINASAYTQSGNVQITLTFSGGTIASTWEMIKSSFEGIEGVDIDNKKHSMTMTQDIDEQEIVEDMMLDSGLQINQNGKKIRIPIDAILEDIAGEIPSEMSGMIPSEFIMIKQ
ncbi:MAG: hypothetical protein LBH20_06500 [Treponema sp.]|jgi:hypothetical protein|nr:hypothetical protein [Treponema sp.]